ncbi:MAG: hypothetical protein M3Z28_08590 [Candidatus Dormibacteraeota bacterium]|nr:hypothetical protein [Candidatus Dormibacteraeota bacterium]
MARIGLVLREGLLFGIIGGVFALLVRLVAVYATHDLTPNVLENFVSSVLGFLIIGGAGRKLAALTKSTNPALQMGALAGGITELFHTVVSALILSYLPVGDVAFNRLSPAAKRAATDTGAQLISLGLDLAVVIVFGAMIGWLGAWTLLTFRPPREPQG